MKITLYKCMLWDDRNDECVYESLIDAPYEEAAEGMFKQELFNTDYDLDEYPILIEETEVDEEE